MDQTAELRTLDETCHQHSRELFRARAFCVTVQHVGSIWRSAKENREAVRGDRSLQQQSSREPALSFAKFGLLEAAKRHLVDVLAVSTVYDMVGALLSLQSRRHGSDTPARKHVAPTLKQWARFREAQRTAHSIKKLASSGKPEGYLSSVPVHVEYKRSAVRYRETSR